MSAFGKSLTAVAAAAALVAVTGLGLAQAQGPWAAPADAKKMKNPVKGVGNAKKSVETN